MVKLGNMSCWLTFNVEADVVSVPIVMFVQPDSMQPCLIGMNAASALGLSFLNAKGQPLKEVVAGHAHVSLV